jgi:hypothetical protein
MGLLAPGLVIGGESLKVNARNRIPDIIFSLCSGKVKPFIRKGEKITVVLNKKLTGVESRTRRNVRTYTFTF